MSQATTTKHDDEPLTISEALILTSDWKGLYDNPEPPQQLPDGRIIIPGGGQPFPDEYLTPSEFIERVTSIYPQWRNRLNRKQAH